MTPERQTTNDKQRFKIAFVIPRYETGRAGGAEIHAAQLAQRLAGRGYAIEVFTTCAEDHHLWFNTLKAGSQTVDGIQVHRFPTDPRMDIGLFRTLQMKMHLGHTLSEAEEAAWLQNSVHSQSLYRTLQERAPDFDGIIFMPYLFGITYEGSRRVSEKFILIPCLHNEPFARLKITRELFHRAQFIFFNTQPEQELAQRLYGIREDHSKRVAVGFDEIHFTDPEMAQSKYGLDHDPYLIFAGRWEKGKNIPLLIEYFKKYLINTGRNLKLVLLGSGEAEVSKAFQDRILKLGFVPLQDKYDLMAGSLAFCQPSVNESLSIVIMEAWSLKTPVLVHGKCNVTRFHCEESQGGLYFSNYFEFEEAIHFLMENEPSRLRMGENGYRYVRENYSWETVLDRFDRAFEAYMARGAS